MADALFKPAFDAVIGAKNFIFEELQDQPTTIELFGLDANNAPESITTLSETWSFDQIHIGMGVWRDEFRVMEDAISAEDMDRVTHVDKAGIRYTIDSKARPEGGRRFWSLMMKPIERVTA